MLPGSQSVNGQCHRHVQRRGAVGLYFVAGLSVLAGTAVFSNGTATCRLPYRIVLPTTGTAQ